MRGGKPIPGKKVGIGSSLFISDRSFFKFVDVSNAYGAKNETAYNRQVSLGDVNLDGFLDIAIGADNVVNQFEGLPLSALLVFQPKDGMFDGGRFEDIGGTDLVPDFGGYYNDPSRDRAGPNIVLRDLDNDGDIDLAQGNHLLVIGGNIPLNRIPFTPAEYRHGFFNWQNKLLETGSFRFEKITDNGFADVGQFRYDEAEGMLVPRGEERAPAITHLFYADVNNDGLFDAIAVAGMNPIGRPATEPVAARFWYNEGNFQFRIATEEAGLDILNQRYAF
ncbi:MAG: FG-GAP repeat protein [Alphaproteobacteria bacterium]|nr:FG-GAP repeat protein [Alphaproteobacteria bacterium]